MTLAELDTIRVNRMHELLNEKGYLGCYAKGIPIASSYFHHLPDSLRGYPVNVRALARE